MCIIHSFIHFFWKKTKQKMETEPIFPFLVFKQKRKHVSCCQDQKTNKQKTMLKLVAI